MLIVRQKLTPACIAGVVGSGYNVNGLWLEWKRENHKFWVLPACMGLTNFVKGNGTRFNRTNMEVIIDNHVAFSVLAGMKMHAGKEGGI